MSNSFVALRQTVYDSLQLAAARYKNFDAAKYQRLDGESQRTKALIDFGVSGSPSGEPDLAEVTFRLAVGGAPKQAEARVEQLAQAVADCLPASIGVPVWSIAYDQDASSWVATGATEAFRE